MQLTCVLGRQCKEAQCDRVIDFTCIRSDDIESLVMQLTCVLGRQCNTAQ